MKRFLLDMNDSELRIAQIGERIDVVTQSCGFALIDGREVVIGERAMQQFRLHPRQANNQFWHRLSTDALPVRGPDTATFADLVYRQLQELARQAQIGPDDELFVAVAGSTSADQLGLLVGIAGELGLQVFGLTDAAVAASAHAPNAPLRHLDVQLHRLVVTELTRRDDCIARERIHDIAELGLIGLMEAWINVLADRFVRDTRFDPLSIAATDQQLSTQLDRWLRDVPQRRNLSVEIQHEGTQRRAELPIEALAAKVAPRYRVLDPLVHAQPVAVSHRGARLPGLVEHLSGIASQVRVLDESALFDGFARATSAIRSGPDALRLVTRLPFTPAATDVAKAAPAAARDVPSHVLHGHDAVPLFDGIELDAQSFGRDNRQPLPSAPRVIAREGAYLLELGTNPDIRLNGLEARSGTLLAKGDVVDVAGERFEFIGVRSAAHPSQG
jgi:hypothetical protein